MAADPLLGLVARALRAEVDAISVERIETSPLAEVDRIRWRGPGGEGRLLFRRMRREASVEAALLPVLARRGLAVENVLASGIPPRHVAEQRPWVLAVEPEGAPLCERGVTDARRAAQAVSATHEAMRDELPLLKALGLPELPPATLRDEALAATALLPRDDADRLRALAAETRVDAVAGAAPTLVHGAFTCERVLVNGDRLVVRDWKRAHVGSGLEDLGALVRSLRARDPAAARAALEGYPVEPELLRDAERLHQLAVVRWYAWEAREGLRHLAECALDIAAALA